MFPASFQTKLPSLPLEVDILLSSTNVVLDEPGAARLDNLVQNEPDWDEVVRLATAHGVLPLVFVNLSNVPKSTIPSRALTELRELYYQNAAHNSLLAHFLADLLQHFQQQHIRAIPFKGPVLATTVYGSLSSRMSGDIDLLVHPRDYRRARSVLLDKGFHLADNWTWQCALTSPGEYKIEVDIHRSILPFWFDMPLDFDELWERCSRTDCGSQSVPILAVEDLLSVLCMSLIKDAAQDTLVLRQVVDIAALLRTRRDFDWRRLWIGDDDATPAVCVSLGIASQLFGCLNPSLESNIRRTKSVERLVESTIKSMFTRSGRICSRLAVASREHLFILLMQRTARRKVRVLALGAARLCVDAVVPTERERAAFLLHPRLSFLYYVIRPLRVGARCLLLTWNGLAARRRSSN